MRFSDNSRALQPIDSTSGPVGYVVESDTGLKVSKGCTFRKTVWHHKPSIPLQDRQDTRPEPDGFSLRWIVSNSGLNVVNDCALQITVGRYNHLTPPKSGPTYQNWRHSIFLKEFYQGPQSQCLRYQSGCT